MYDTINVLQAAAELNMDQATIRKRIKSGEIPTLKTGRKNILTPTVLEYFKFCSEHKVTLAGLKKQAKTLCFSNNKGGCSKSTSAYTIAAILNTFKDTKVLLVDSDPQGNSTQMVLEPIYNESGIVIPFQDTIKDLLKEKKDRGTVGVSRIKEVIRESKFGFDAIPCDLSLNSVISDLENSSFKEVILKELLQEISSEYDYIILDTPPTLGFSVISALTASDYVSIVTLAEAFSLIGVEQTVNLIDTVRNQNSVLAKPKAIKILGVIISKAEMQTNISKHFIQELNEFTKDNEIVLWKEFLIPKTTKIPETQATGELITDVDPKGDAALNYFNIAMKIEMEIKKDRIKEKLGGFNGI